MPLVVYKKNVEHKISPVFLTVSQNFSRFKNCFLKYRGMNLFTVFLSIPMLFNIIVFMNALFTVYEFLQAMTDLMTSLFAHA